MDLDKELLHKDWFREVTQDLDKKRYPLDVTKVKQPIDSVINWGKCEEIFGLLNEDISR